ncbi:MAG: CAP domain-containing protein [Thermoanaerobaculia bacterium]|nr:CAP domain-containing protein [Thermoanaerobaculia bacterium]
MHRARKILLAVVIAAVLLPTTEARADLRAQVREKLLVRINSDRAEHGLSPVKIDLFASEIADRYCGAQIESGTRGHVSVDGLLPYMRYSFAGLEGYVLENAAAWSSESPVPRELVAAMAEKSHQKMMSERPPDDGHRRVILDPWATHVGIGVAWGGGEVRIAEVFLRRYLQWIFPKRTGRPGDTVSLRARLFGTTEVDRVTVHYEPFPYRLTRERANRVETYALPGETLTLRRGRMPSHFDAAIPSSTDREPDTFRISEDELSFDVPLTRGRGVYTIVVWMKGPADGAAFAVTTLGVIADADRPGGSTGR